jgi:subtilase family serine protease
VIKTKPETQLIPYLTGRANPKDKTQKVILTSQQLNQIFSKSYVFEFGALPACRGAGTFEFI